MIQPRLNERTHFSMKTEKSKSVQNEKKLRMRKHFGLALIGWCALTACVGTATPVDRLADETPSSAVSWICPNEPFNAGIGKTRFYRYAFMTRNGLVRATARWWIDDWGFVHVDGKKVPASAKMVETPVDLTAALANAGRHVLAVEGKNLAGTGGVCLSIVLEYADGKNETVYSSESWLCATNVPSGWTAPRRRRKTAWPISTS